jgi:hypothetical protein
MVQLFVTKVRCLIAVAHFLTYIGLKNLVLDLILALQILPTACLLPSPNNCGTLFGDLSRFNSVVDSDDFDIKSVVLLGLMLQAVISVTVVNLARVPKALEGEARRDSGLEVAGKGRKGRLCRKGSRTMGRSKCAARQRALIPSFLPVIVIVNLIAVNQMDPHDSDSSNGGSRVPFAVHNPRKVPLSTIPVMRCISAARSS